MTICICGCQRPVSECLSSGLPVDLIREAANQWQVDPVLLESRSRDYRRTQARRLAMALCCELTRESHSVTAQWFKSDRATVTYAYQRMRDEVAENPNSRPSRIFTALLAKFKP